LRGILARRGDRFVDRYCREGEARRREGAPGLQHLGGLFAAKEAVLKALGTGWAEGLTLRQVEIVRGLAGRPEVRLHDAARKRAESLGVHAIHLSITHERSLAAAVALLEGAA
jgi:holo-[acyl-carrier protein] synthase